MNSQEAELDKNKLKEDPVDIKSYVLGFIFAIILSLVAYFIVVNHLLSGPMLIGTIMGLALTQLLVQLVFFLHFGRKKDSDSRLSAAAFYFMLIVLVVIVAGSLWIMSNLNYNMMSPDKMDQYMLKQSGKGF